jgi:hypothetical protein
MDAREAMLEFAEKRAEYRGRQRLDPEPRAMLIEAKKRYPEGQLPVDDLLRSYFMYYAAALAAPDESADVTLDRWLKSYAATSPPEQTNFREFDKGEVRRIPLPRTQVNRPGFRYRGGVSVW